MENIPDVEILEFRPDTLEAVRKDVDLDKQKIDKSVDLLQDWLQKQIHFTKKDFSRSYLERTLVTCKGSVERTKQMLDKLCTFRTLMPEFFNTTNVKKEFESLKLYVYYAPLPKLSYEHHRIAVLKLIADNYDSNELFKFYKCVAMFGEYLKIHEYTAGFIMVIDVRDANPLNIVTPMSPLMLRKVFTLLIDGYGMRIKGIHLITSSKLIDAVVTMLKQVLSEKIASRIFVHDTFETVFKHVPQEILPIDFGGEEKPLRQLCEQWMEILASEKNMENYREMQNAKTIESCRQADHFNEHYIGMPGSFRALSVD